MIKHKKNSGKGGLFGKKGQTSNRQQTATTYTLELLESRVLLSADLAGAVQAVPVNQAVPQQAVVLNVEAAASVGQQTFCVALLV